MLTMGSRMSLTRHLVVKDCNDVLSPQINLLFNSKPNAKKLNKIKKPQYFEMMLYKHCKHWDTSYLCYYTEASSTEIAIYYRKYPQYLAALIF